MNSLTENICIMIYISIKPALLGPINHKSALLWVMAWHSIGAKPLAEPMLTKIYGVMS